MTNKQKKALLFSAILSVPLLSAAAVVLRAIALFTAFDGKEYFSPDSPLPSAFVVLTLAAAFVFLLFALIARKKLTIRTAEKTELSILFSSAFLSVSLAVTVFVSILSALQTEGPYIPLFYALIAAFGLASIGYFSYALRSLPPTRSTFRTYLSLSPCLLSLTGAILLYFDQSTQMNAPAKLLSLAAFLFLSCAFLVECRFYLSAPSPAMRYLSLAVGFYLALSSSLPNLIYTLARGTVLSLSTVFDFLLFAFALYLLANLFELLPEGDRDTHCMVKDAVLFEESKEAAAEEKPEDAPAEETPAEATAEESAPKKRRTKKKEVEAEAKDAPAADQGKAE